MNLPRITAFTVLLIVLTNSVLFGQGWTDDGTVVRLTTSTDNVGIGTTGPATKLHVFGTVTAARVTTGIWNSFFGENAGFNTIVGPNNSFFGVYAGYRNTNGYSNSFFGHYAGFANTTGFDNSFFGHYAGTANTIGTDNSFFGVAAGLSNTTGIANSFFGEQAGYYNTTGYSNSFFGEDAGYANTTGYWNSFFGKSAGNSNTTGYNNSFFGHDAGKANTSGYQNSFFGKRAGYANSTGYRNSFFGDSAGNSNTTGYNNSFFGHDAGYSNTDGGGNSFFGQNAGYSNTTGGVNSFFGINAGYSNTTGIYNSFFGRSAGYSNTTADANSFFGREAGPANTTGYWNSIFGVYAGFANTTGHSNSFFGNWAGYDNSTGRYNTAVGLLAKVGGTYDNSTGLGYNASCTASNQVRIGNSFVTSIGGYTNWTNISDSRFKKNVQEDVKGLDFVMALRPVSYNLDLHAVENFFVNHYGERQTETLPGQYDKESIRYSGFIAQEVETAAKGVGYDFSGVDPPKNQDDFYGLRYAEFVVPLVKAVQEQQETINLLVAALKANGIDITLPGKGKAAPKEQGKDLGSEIIQTPGNAADLGALPLNYDVSRNYPTPFNPSTTIEYALPTAGQVTIKVYNGLGQEVRTLVDGFQEAGYKSVIWDGKNQIGSPVASGSYMYRVTAGNYVKSEKMILAK